MKKILLASLILSSIATSSFAATDGTLGSTSTGTLNVDLNIANLVKIAGLTDIALDTTASDGQGNFVDAVGVSNFCVYANNGAGTFSLTATGDGTGGAFSLSDGAGVNDVAYQVNFLNGVDRTDTVGGQPLTAGTSISTDGGSIDAGALDCNSDADDTSTIWVSVPGSELTGKPSGDYSGVLTLEVAAQ